MNGYILFGNYDRDEAVGGGHVNVCIKVPQVTVRILNADLLYIVLRIGTAKGGRGRRRIVHPGSKDGEGKCQHKKDSILSNLSHLPGQRPLCRWRGSSELKPASVSM